MENSSPMCPKARYSMIRKTHFLAEWYDQFWICLQIVQAHFYQRKSKFQMLEQFFLLRLYLAKIQYSWRENHGCGCCRNWIYCRPIRNEECRWTQKSNLVMFECENLNTVLVFCVCFLWRFMTLIWCLLSTDAGPASVITVSNVPDASVDQTPLRMPRTFWPMPGVFLALGITCRMENKIEITVCSNPAHTSLRQSPFFHLKKIEDVFGLYILEYFQCKMFALAL